MGFAGVRKEILQHRDEIAAAIVDHAERASDRTDVVSKDLRRERMHLRRF
jgi:hypothetical protein